MHFVIYPAKKQIKMMIFLNVDAEELIDSCLAY